MSAAVIKLHHVLKSKPHALKLESLDISRNYADEIKTELNNFLSNLGYSKDHIEALNCRACDGFIPYSHNKGGLRGNAFRDQYNACESTGFENTDKILIKYYNYDLESFLKDQGLSELDYDNEELLEDFDSYRMSDNPTISYTVDCMVTSETTLAVNCYVDAKDTPYHRTYDDKFEIEITFKSIAGLKQKLKRLENKAFFKCLRQNLREVW